MVWYSLNVEESKEIRIKEASIAEFSSVATRSEFEEIAERGFWESEKILIEKYFKPNTSILDLGCGSGRTTIPLYRAGYRIIGVDITPEMIEAALSVSKAKNLKIDYRIGDATQLDFGDNIFDGAIFANNGWAQIPGKDNRQKALNETYRVLKSGGIFIFTSHERYISRKTFMFWLREFIHMAGAGEVKEQVGRAGFTLVLEQKMGDIAKSDAQAMRGSLNKSFDSHKSPVFYVCKKP
ncbi:MAG: Methyltransferase type 11 [Parcubacteria group bacterium GW2011_GWA2_46_10]|nr:MAG: Methyltransferase type 11 [Parcubacteria group bacterium GW2011_GWA2_46_10]